MNKIRRSFFWLVFLLVFSSIYSTLSAQSHNEYLYAGSFSGKGNKGIYVFKLQRPNGTLTLLQTVTSGRSPSFLALSPDKRNLYAVYESDDSVVSFHINPLNGHLNRLNARSAQGRGPAHVSVDPKGRFVYISNYGSGSLCVYKRTADGSLGKLTQVIRDEGSGPHPHQKGPHVHSVIPSSDGEFVYICDLGNDKLFCYQVQSTGKLVPSEVPFYQRPPGSGPRQFALSPDGKYAALVEELISGLVFFKRDIKSGRLTEIQNFSMLPDSCSERGSDATVFFSPDNKFVYATNWGPFGITVYSLNRETGKLNVADKEETGGFEPRDICIDKKGQFVFVANMGSGNLAVLKRNQLTGKLSLTENGTPVQNIACIVEW
ncbi:MAG: lactonase family protein [Ginsengibacter sp.]